MWCREGLNLYIAVLINNSFLKYLMAVYAPSLVIILLNASYNFV